MAGRGVPGNVIPLENSGQAVTSGALSNGLTAQGIGGKAGGGGPADHDGRATIAMVGGQREIAPGRFLGGVAGYENSRITSDGGAAVVDGEAGLAVQALKRQDGPLPLAGAVDLGHGWYDSRRDIGLGGDRAA